MTPRFPLWVRLVPVLLIAAAAATAISNRDEVSPAALEAAVGLAGIWMGPAFVLAHAAGILVALPRWAFAIAAGLLFGFPEGIAWAVAGTLAGTSLGFFVARFANSGALKPHEWARVGPWIARAEQSGWRAVALARLLPIPGALVTYGFGLSRLRYLSFLLGTALGTLPVAVVFANLGAAGWTDPEAAKGALVLAVAAALVFVAATALAPRLLRGRA
jgi:uncharacterized membrane protein YdjX (TVP38/TMEM64 family)